MHTCVCMYVCMYVCIYIYIYNLCIYKYMDTYTDRHAYLYSAHLPALMCHGTGGWLDGDVNADFNPKSDRVERAVAEAGMGHRELDIIRQKPQGILTFA